MQCYIDCLFVKALLMLNASQFSLLEINMTKINLGLATSYHCHLFL